MYNDADITKYATVYELEIIKNVIRPYVIHCFHLHLFFLLIIKSMKVSSTRFLLANVI